MMLDIPPHIEKFISSQEMGDSEIQVRLLYLGKKLQESLEKHNGDEVIAWMAHYLAEKMAAIDSARDEAKALTKRECFETILLFWEYRAYLPNEIRPFYNLEPIFHALENIDPNKAVPSFFKSKNQDNKFPNEIEQAIAIITGLDTASRIIISFFVKGAMLHALDKPTLEWLDAISGITRSDEVKILSKFIPELDDEDTSQDKNAKRKNELSEHIDRLEAFEKLSSEIRSVLKNELENFKT